MSQKGGVYDLIESALKKVLLVVEKGVQDLKIPLGNMKNLNVFIRTYRLLEKREAELEDLKKIYKERLVDLMLRHPGLKGVQTLPDNHRTLVYQSDGSYEYNLPLLKESLGEAYSGLVNEDLRLTIMLTPDYKQFLLLKILKSFFRTKEAYNKLVKEEVIPRVDEKKLELLIKEGKVRLKDGTRVETKKPAWHVKTTLIKQK